MKPQPKEHAPGGLAAADQEVGTPPLAEAPGPAPPDIEADDDTFIVEVPPPWSAERTAFEDRLVTDMVAHGVPPVAAQDLVERVTNQERYDQARAAGFDEADAAAMVAGARVIEYLASGPTARAYRQRRVGDFIVGSLARLEAGKPPQRPTGDIAVDTDGELVPRYEVLPRRAWRVREGDRLVDPNLGEVRVAWVANGGYDQARDSRLIQLQVIPVTDTTVVLQTVPAEHRLEVRVPEQQERAGIQQAIDRAYYAKTTIDDRTARLIAAHLQRSPDSALYRLAITGEVHLPELIEEFETLAGGRPYVRRWAVALRAYCTARKDRGPLIGLEDRQW